MTAADINGPAYTLAEHLDGAVSDSTDGFV
jgi:hypothetical protein